MTHRLLPSASTLASLLLGLTLLAFSLPLVPRMPEAGLDPSFAFALNMAVAQGLRFGHDIIFTLGPYAPVYTAMYHPSTDLLMLLGSLMIGLGYAACLFILNSGRHWLLGVLLSLALAALLSSRDALLLAYPLGACFALARLGTSPAISNKLTIIWPALLMAPFGLLLLTKGSFAVLCIALTGLSAVYLARRYSARHALAAIASPLLSMLGLWLLADQRLVDLPAYFFTQIPVITGFANAMSWPGPANEVLLWCAGALSMFAGLGFSTLPRATKIFIALAFACFAFLAFKAGFVRHDMHVLIASEALLLAGAFMILLAPSRGIWLSLLLLPACWIKLEAQRPHTEDRPQHVLALYVSAAQGLWQRASQPELLQLQYRNRLTALHTRYNFPALVGNTDIYSVNQAELFASGNQWRPRPILQSYSAYTPELARWNAAYLSSAQAPDNILFRLEPIDQRLPAQEDGASWLSLLNHYELTRQLNSGYLLLRKKAQPANNALRAVSSQNAQLNQWVDVPEAAGPVFFQTQLTPSLLGRLTGLLYKSATLNIDIAQSNGTIRTFRFIPAMAAEPILLSPLVLQTAEFASLFVGRALDEQRLKRFRIHPSPDTQDWQSHYTVTFSSVQLPAHSTAPPVENATAIYLTKEQASPLPEVQCEGQIDKVNGQNYSSTLPWSKGPIAIEGWNAVSGKAGLAPDAVFIGVTEAQGNVKLTRATLTARPDVNSFFNRPELPETGFSVTLDDPSRTDHDHLNVFRLNQGTLEKCRGQ